MNIILLNNFCKRKGSIDICMPSALGLFISGFLLIVGVSVGTGYYYGKQQGSAIVDEPYADVVQVLTADREALKEEKAQLQAHLDALSIRIGSLQAQMLRIDALGERLVDIGQLDSDEFDFTKEPAIGGIDAPENEASRSIQDLISDVDGFNQLVEDRMQKLDILEELIATGKLYEEITPSGRPVIKGWLSSRFGKRIDPKTGKKTLHHGHDYAGKAGADVVAVASGLIVRAEYQKGFGNMIEIKHPDGYSTLYAHNKKNLVAVGDMVKKGEKIALLGSTGRSTGPHVHFEVRKNGKYINPNKYVKR
jgi:murein DD-endopeptidase MepM/ murein hydrolase activator NlpD